jgi:hypothetical protein
MRWTKLFVLTGIVSTMILGGLSERTEAQNTGGTPQPTAGTALNINASRDANAQNAAGRRDSALLDNAARQPNNQSLDAVLNPGGTTSGGAQAGQRGTELTFESKSELPDDSPSAQPSRGAAPSSRMSPLHPRQVSGPAKIRQKQGFASEVVSQSRSILFDDNLVTVDAPIIMEYRWDTPSRPIDGSRSAGNIEQRETSAAVTVEKRSRLQPKRRKIR